MDKLTDTNTTDRLRKENLLSRTLGFWRKSAAKHKEERGALIYELLIFSVGFILSRCHLVFGAYPLGIAFSATMHTSVFSALFGVVVGYLSMGESGVILACASAILVFLRAALSFGKADDLPFCEPLILRISLSVISGFIVASYSALTVGITEGVVLYGVATVLLPPLITFVFSGLICTSLTTDVLIFGTEDVFSLSKKKVGEKYDLIFFQISALLLIFFVSLSLSRIIIFGISLSYVFTSVLALAVAKRFGALRALAVGFVGALGVSGIYSVAFALMGLGAGIMFSFGTGYAIITGGAALSAWGVYASGLAGFLSTFPEYAIAATLCLPLLKKIGEIKPSEEISDTERGAEEMIGTMALAYQNSFSGSVDSLSAVISDVAGVMREYSSTKSYVTEEQYVAMINEISDAECAACRERTLCNTVQIEPCKKNAIKLAKKLASGERVSSSDVNSDTEFCLCAEKISKKINERAEELKRLATDCTNDSIIEDYDLISHMINGAKMSDSAELAIDESLTEPLTRAVCDAGFEEGVIRVFGERRKRIFLAGEDAGAKKITDKKIRENIEKVLNSRLSAPTYYKCGKMMLMECGLERKYEVSIATASAPRCDGEISGDSVTSFETANGTFYALLSDGMGSGSVAKQTSELVTKLMRHVLEIDSSKDTVLHLLNRTLMRQKEECSATVDLFMLDLLSGEATFLKSGAAPSYLKRESSIFRIRSQSAPIGLLGTIDSEKIRVEVRGGDYILVLSDGISASTEDAPWLLELLCSPPPKSLSDYAKKIIDEARKNAKFKDDMSLILIKIDEVQ